MINIDKIVEDQGLYSLVIDFVTGNEGTHVVGNAAIVSVKLPTVDDSVSISESKKLVNDIIRTAKHKADRSELQMAFVPSAGYPIKFMWTLIGEILSEDAVVLDEDGEAYTDYYCQGYIDGRRDY